MPTTPISPLGRSGPFRRPGGVPPPSASSRYAELETEDGALVMGGNRDSEVVGLVSGGREMGVTRPKRRLSSLTSLPTSPSFSNTPSLHEYRALSATSSPPVSPGGAAAYSAPSLDAIAQAHRNDTAPNVPSLARQAPTVRIDEKAPAYVPATTPAAREQGPPKLFGIELKWISLITLALQNAFLTIIMHYSRIATAPNKTYSAAAAVLFNELLKGAISTLVALKRIDNDMSAQATQKESRNRPVQTGFTMFKANRLGTLRRAVLSGDCYKLAIPAILYVIQNNLQYVAASNLDVATFQVTYQMKILTTAFFSVLMLGKRLSRAKWCALVMLALGVGIVQLQSTAAPGHAASASSHSKISLRDELPEADKVVSRAVDAATATLPATMRPFRGFVAVTMACLTSGLAGVYFEVLLKSGTSSGTPDLWVRNTQLSLFSLIPALVPILFTGHSPNMSWFGNVASKFANFNGWAIGTVLTQTFGGLITAIVIRYSDNIMKGFATSLSIIISFLASVALFNYPITFSFVAGACVVLAATFLYNSPSIPDAPPTRKTVAVAPGSPIPTSAPILGEPQAPSRTSSVINLLAGLGSRPGSRRSSGSEAPPRPFVPVPSLSRAGSYTGTQGGTPFAHSAQNSHTQLNEFDRMSPGPSPTKTTASGKVRPQLSLDTTSL
ncbi:hypothetical protein CspeluHIS016_0205530 [Cutaneotrichosporon spelunceum]|uniref:Nucleotide-sugar transporter n=1 Tax=Cutaneotrichosporon spelunceum TaxID=1672016 RepID=A0AAD3TS62_9TREE|nr:hypothetical protein CspeluHIS016_0205530 [Cutaneotrichosporon spelunceum]